MELHPGEFNQTPAIASLNILIANMPPSLMETARAAGCFEEEPQGEVIDVTSEEPNESKPT